MANFAEKSKIHNISLGNSNQSYYNSVSTQNIMQYICSGAIEQWVIEN